MICQNRSSAGSGHRRWIKQNLARWRKAPEIHPDCPPPLIHMQGEGPMHGLSQNGLALLLPAQNITCFRSFKCSDSCKNKPVSYLCKNYLYSVLLKWNPCQTCGVEKSQFWGQCTSSKNPFYSLFNPLLSILRSTSSWLIWLPWCDSLLLLYATCHNIAEPPDASCPPRDLALGTSLFWAIAQCWGASLMACGLSITNTSQCGYNFDGGDESMSPGSCRLEKSLKKAFLEVYKDR